MRSTTDISAALNIEQQINTVPTLPVSIIERAAYRTIFDIGGILDDLDVSDVGGLKSAKKNACEFSNSIIDVLKEI